jgi:D-3-phosphoglycerate dehydrogenase
MSSPAPARVLITPRSLTTAGSAAEVFEPLRRRGAELVLGPSGRQPTEAELRDLLPGITHWIAGVEPIGRAQLASADQLKVISRYGVGTDSIDLAETQRRGIVIERAVGANARAVAELALAQIMNGLRGIVPAAWSVQTGGWERRQGRELPDCTVGLVGLGAVGSLLASLVAALGARVVGTDPVTRPPDVEWLPLDQVFKVSDAVSLHCPVPPDGTALVGAAQLDLMPEGAILVNTARSTLVDEDAVLAALESGRLACYAVDAFPVEPPPPSPLLRHPHLIGTPHLGGYTAASTSRMAAMAVANVVKHLDRQ